MVSAAILVAFIVMPEQAQSSASLDSALAGRDSAKSAMRHYRGSVYRTSLASSQPEYRDRDYFENASHMERLIERLDHAAKLAPRDQWIMSLRTSWKVAYGDHEGAEAVVAATCADPLWWCSALRGYIRRFMDDYATAEFHFDIALAQMSTAQRCLWNDLSLVLPDPALRDAYRKHNCGQQSALNRMIWWIADPHWSDDWNDRRIEHHVRWVAAELLSRESEEMGWAEFRLEPGNRSLQRVLRTGTLKWCEVLNRERPTVSQVFGVPVNRCPPDTRVIAVGNMSPAHLDLRKLYPGAGPGASRQYWENQPMISFLPRIGAVDGAFNTGLLDDDLQPRERLRSDFLVYPGRGAEHHNILIASEWHYPYSGWQHIVSDMQTGMLLRGDTAYLLASWNPATDLEMTDGGLALGSFRLLQAADLRVALVLATDTGATREAWVVEHLARDSTLRMKVPTTLDSAILSLEAFSTKNPVGARRRFAVHRPSRAGTSGVAMSDVIMYAPDSTGAEISAANVGELMLPRSTVESSESTGLFWEMYGLRAGQVPTFQLAVEPVERGGIFRSLAEALRLRASASTVATRWKENAIAEDQIGEHGASTHTIVLDLKSLTAGMYRLTVKCEVDGVETAQVSRMLRVN